MAGALATAAGYDVSQLTKDPTAFDLNAMAGNMQQATTYSPSSDSLVSGQLERLLSKDSDYMVRARTKAAQTAGSRGLLNSSIAAGAGEAAAIDAALPIAQADANSYFTAQRDNAAATNTFSNEANAFGRTGALEKYKGALAMASQGLDLAQDDKRIALQRDTLNADTAYRTADLDFRKDSAGRELSLKDRELSLTDAYRMRQLDQDQQRQTDNLALERDRLGLQRDQLSADSAKLDQQARSALAGDIAQIRQQAAQSQAALEADPNMSAEAKANAIMNLSAKASADIAELVRFSGINLPDAWPDWINQIGTPAAPGLPPEDGVAAEAPAPAPAPSSGRPGMNYGFDFVDPAERNGA